MAFDQRRYEDEVVKPLRGRTADLPDDLVVRYAIDLASTGTDLERRLREVRAYWNNKARSASTLGQVCAAFLRADEKLKAEHGETALLDPAWWRRRQADRDRGRPAAVAALAQDLAAAYGELGAVTAERLAGVAGSHGDLSEGEIARAVAEAGLQVVPARALPAERDVDRAVLRAVADGVVEAGAASVPALLHPDSGDFTLLDRFSGTPRPGGGLDLAAVEARSAALDRARDSATSGPAKHVLGRLRTAAKAGTDLRVLSLVHVLQGARARRDAGATPAGVVRTLRRLGIAEDEARTLTVHLLAESAAPADPLDEFRDLLAEGKPGAAGRLVAGLPAEAAAEGRALLDRHTAHVDDLRAQAHRSLATGDPETAEEKLRAATELATDRQDIAEELARLPLRAVVSVAVAPEGTGTRVTWTVPPSHRDDTHYRLVRREDRAPGDVGDGEVVATTTGALAAEDPGPPVGRTLHYGVFAARRPEGPWSSPVVGSGRVVPPVSDLQIAGEKAAVVARWTAHRDTVRVAVRRVDRSAGPQAGGIEIEAGTRTFTDRTAMPGTDYFYEVVAIYADPAGPGELRAEAVRGRGGLLAEAAPVATLQVVADHDDLVPHLVVRWRTPPGADVEVRLARTPPPGEFGELLPAAGVDAWGSELGGVPRTESDWTSVRVPAPHGRVHVAAFTRRPGGRIRGLDQDFEFVPPPRRLQAQRRGETVVLTWIWPDDIRVAEIRWPEHEARVALSRYRDEGGFALPSDADGEVEVRSVVGSGPEQSASVPVTVTVAAAPRKVRYALRVDGSRFSRRRECVVTLAPGQDGPPVPVVLVASPGPRMPLAARPEDVVAEGELDPSGEGPAELRVPYPRLRRPFWFRCFPGRDDVALDDPPASDLKEP